MGRLGGSAGRWRGVFLTLAVLALALKVLVPPGFMVAGDRDAAPGLLVICTGHGPLALGDRGDAKAPAHKTSDAPCAFAGSAAPPTPSAPAIVAPPRLLVADQLARVQAADLAPGRGLAAPPPPSHAPPAVPI